MTQVASPTEGQVFHNRLSHTLEVAQIARRLCERLRATQPADCEAIGLDADSPDIVEAAALAHDLGHPPFGHLAETLLGELAAGRDPAVSFEGNAQSFRIVALLTPLGRGKKGLDLCRATLNATLKYPWVHDNGPPDRKKKWGAYESERAAFEFARDGDHSFRQSPEAAIMDLADDIAYSTHDLIDFYRAGLIPLLEIEQGLPDELRAFRSSKQKVSRTLITRYSGTIPDFVEPWAFPRFQGTYAEIVELSALTSALITEFFSAVSIRVGRIVMSDEQRVKVSFLQDLVRRYVISNPRLQTQQEGQRKIISDLFNIYCDALKGKRTKVLPPAFAHRCETATGKHKMLTTSQATRLVVDVIASFTDEQAWRIHRRLAGESLGSFADILYS